MGGNLGASIGPLFAAVVVLRYGQGSVAVFALAAVVGMDVVVRRGRWYAATAWRACALKPPRQRDRNCRGSS
jgi:hypothetical protein